VVVELLDVVVVVVVVEVGTVVVVVELELELVVLPATVVDVLVEVELDVAEPWLPTVVVVVVELDAECLLATCFVTGTPQGPLEPERCGRANGLLGCPGFTAPRPTTTMAAHAAAVPRTADPIATGRSAATRRSRACSLRLRCSSAGDNWVR
jgi:hypothetical protein